MKKHLARTQSYARSRLVEESRAKEDQRLNEATRQQKLALFREHMEAARQKEAQNVEEQKKQRVTKKEAEDAEMRTRKAHVDNQKASVTKFKDSQKRGSDTEYTSEEDKPKDTTIPKKTRYMMRGKDLGYSGDDDEPKKKQPRTNKSAPQKKPLETVQAHEALNKGLKTAAGIVPGKTAQRVRLRKGIKAGLSAVKSKASVEPQPESNLTVVNSKVHKTILPIKNPSRKRDKPRPALTVQ